MSILSDLLNGKDKEVIKAKNLAKKEVAKKLADEEYEKIDLSEYDFSDKQLAFLRQLVGADFNISLTCVRAGVSREAYRKWMMEPEFKKAFDDYEEIITQIARATVTKAAKLGDVKAAQFLLERLDKRFKKKVDLTSNGQSMGAIIQIVKPDEPTKDN